MTLARLPNELRQDILQIIVDEYMKVQLPDITYPQQTPPRILVPHVLRLCHINQQIRRDMEPVARMCIRHIEPHFEALRRIIEAQEVQEWAAYSGTSHRLEALRNMKRTGAELFRVVRTLKDLCGQIRSEHEKGGEETEISQTPRPGVTASWTLSRLIQLLSSRIRT